MPGPLQAHCGPTARHKLIPGGRPTVRVCRINGRSVDRGRRRGRKEAPKADRSSDRIAAAGMRAHGRPSASLRMLCVACKNRKSATRKRPASRIAPPRGTPGRCRAAPSCSRYWRRSLVPAGAQNSWRSTFLPAPTRNAAQDRPCRRPRRCAVAGLTTLDRTSYGLRRASIGRALRHSCIAASKRRQNVGAIPQLAAKPVELVGCLPRNCVAFKLFAEIRLCIARRTRP